MPLTHAPEIGAINSTPDASASFSCRYTTSNVIDCIRVASNLGLWHRFLESVSGACVTGLTCSILEYTRITLYHSMVNTRCDMLAAIVAATNAETVAAATLLVIITDIRHYTFHLHRCNCLRYA